MLMGWCSVAVNKTNDRPGGSFHQLLFRPLEVAPAIYVGLWNVAKAAQEVRDKSLPEASNQCCGLAQANLTAFREGGFNFWRDVPISGHRSLKSSPPSAGLAPAILFGYCVHCINIDRCPDPVWLHHL